MVHVGSLIALLIFYIVIFVVGILAAWKKTRKIKDSNASETLIVARRDINVIVGFFTMTAIWVGGGYITGTTEAVFKYGLIWAQAPVGYSLSLIIGGMFFAKPMRERLYVTMLDPFQKKYGPTIGALMYIPAFIGEVFWSAAILASLGAAISVITELDFKIAVIVSGTVAVLYTFFGGQYSVCYTDVAQLILITFGLVLCTPFAWYSPFVYWNQDPKADSFTNITMLQRNGTAFNETITIVDGNGTVPDENSTGPPVIRDWIGVVQPIEIPRYIDEYLLLIFGGIPWQDYFLRVLSAKTTQNAQTLSITGGFLCFIFSIPSVIIGYIAINTDWTAAGYSEEKVMANSQLVLPLVLQYLTPKFVAFCGLGAVAAGVMSSTDASVLSSSSMFMHNIYRTLIHKRSSDTETVWVLRVGFIVAGAIASILAIVDQSVYALWVFCSDFVYVVLFPQLVCVLFCDFVNSYGVIAGSVISLIFRICGGEDSLYIPPVLKYPYFDYVNNKQIFPFKTFCTLLNFAITWLVSLAANAVLKKRPQYNFLNIPLGIHAKELELQKNIADSNLECNNEDYSVVIKVD